MAVVRFVFVAQQKLLGLHQVPPVLPAVRRCKPFSFLRAAIHHLSIRMAVVLRFVFLLAQKKLDSTSTRRIPTTITSRSSLPCIIFCYYFFVVAPYFRKTTSTTIISPRRKEEERDDDSRFKSLNLNTHTLLIIS